MNGELYVSPSGNRSLERNRQRILAEWRTNELQLLWRRLLRPPRQQQKQLGQLVGCPILNDAGEEGWEMLVG